jgi:hypothetical protein
MKASALGDSYTLSALIDELDTVERYERQGHRSHILALTDKQKEVYKALGVAPPALS